MRRRSSFTRAATAQGAQGGESESDGGEVQAIRPSPTRIRATSECVSTLRQAWSRELPETAMCVQVVDVQCVLQFTSLLAAGCALHRLASRVIHRSEFSLSFLDFVKVCLPLTHSFRIRERKKKRQGRSSGSGAGSLEAPSLNLTHTVS